MKSYFLPTFFFKKQWIWFADPHDVPSVDMVTFLSYSDIQVPGFSQKRGYTSIIKLNRDLSEIWSNMRKKFVREQIKKGEIKGIQVYKDSNFKEFKKIYTSFRQGKGIESENFSVFEKNGILFSAYLDGRMLAGGVFIADEFTIRAWILASARFDRNRDFSREMVGQANRMVIWEAIRWAHSEGMEFFDLGGIDVNLTENLSSLTEFKEAFGGERMQNFYYTKTYSRMLRKLITIKSLFKK